MEVSSDPGVEEDETVMGCDCRTLNGSICRCFSVALLVRQEARQVMRMCCNDPNAPHHKNEEQPKETSQKSSPEQPTLFHGALWMPVSKSKV